MRAKLSMQEKIDLLRDRNARVVFANLMRRRVLGRLQRHGRIIEDFDVVREILPKNRTRVYFDAVREQRKIVLKYLLGRELLDGSLEATHLLKPMFEGRAPNISVFVRRGGSKEDAGRLLNELQAFVKRVSDESGRRWEIYGTSKREERRFNPRFVSGLRSRFHDVMHFVDRAIWLDK